LSIQAGEESEIFLGIGRKSPYLCIDETVNNKYKHLKNKIMTTKNFNAKKMLMSTVAAVVFSFVFTTSADAGTPFGGASAHKCYIEAHKCHKCSTDKKQEQKQEEEDDSNKGFITYFLEKVFGIK
jgi:hypothetical protein